MTFSSPESPRVAGEGSLAARLARSDGIHPPRSLSRTDQERFLAEAHIAVLSVDAGPARPPMSVPLWYAYEPGGDIVVNTSVSSRKARLLRTAGAATLTVQHGAPPYRYVVVEGGVVDDIHPAPIAVRRDIARRYLSAEGADAAVDRYDPDDQVLFVIRPQRWYSADFSGVSTRVADDPIGPAASARPVHDTGVRHGR
ncbi:pyridoxamine 5-phosphate oxidase [Nocardia speluncae]|uniref:Pyridoxamine 5-phosphate oxidase n=1 Tax=Nocardia speluncae TaxID=419477 RepID=A0A846XAS3_9NOCA|nr:pyridoxamine 5-phosphate oxidase [Nocardia speluncae]